VIRFTSLGSGSAGNALLVERGQTRLLVDCGFAVRDLVVRLLSRQCTPEELSGILVTHEHGDHISGVFRLARKFGLPVWLTHGTWVASRESDADLDIRIIDSDRSLTIGDWEVLPFTVPHDARQPVQYLFAAEGRKLGVLTDIGEITPHVCDVLSGCSGLVLEFNHDAGMLARSTYPASLKRRIGGRFGHLENDAAGALLSRIDCSRLQHLVAAHLSERNNCETLVRAAIARSIGCELDWPVVATPDSGFDWRCLV